MNKKERQQKDRFLYYKKYQKETVGNGFNESLANLASLFAVL
jgi:hypothetical protein